MPRSDTVSVHSRDDNFCDLVYQELRQLAHSKMSKEYVYSTLQGTALVHEAYIRLLGERSQSWESRRHFFLAASEAMRRILIDNARRKKSHKRGGHQRRVDLDNIELADQDSPGDLLDDELRLASL